MKRHTFMTLVFSVVLVTLAAVGQSAETVETKNAEELGIVRALNTNIKMDVLVQSLELFKSLPAEKQAEIKEKMLKMSNERNKAIKAVGQQIKDVKIQKLSLVIKKQAERISELRTTIEKLGIGT